MSHAHRVVDALCSTRHQPPQSRKRLDSGAFRINRPSPARTPRGPRTPTHAPTKRDFMSQCNIFSTVARRQFVGSTLTTHDAFCPRSLVRRLRSVAGRRQMARALSLMLRRAALASRSPAGRCICCSGRRRTCRCSSRQWALPPCCCSRCPASPLAQPWSIIGGNLVSATVGVACATGSPTRSLRPRSRSRIAICVMFALRCVHPPSGAVALTAVLGGPSIHSLGFRFVLSRSRCSRSRCSRRRSCIHALTGHRYPHARAQAAGAGKASRASTRTGLHPRGPRSRAGAPRRNARHRPGRPGIGGERSAVAGVRPHLQRTDLRGHHVPPGRVRLRDDDGHHRRATY